MDRLGDGAGQTNAKNQVTIFLTMEQSRHARDALAKAVYAAMFEWVVGRTNECIEAKQAEVMTEDRIFIGLLDIFGEDLHRKQSSAMCRENRFSSF